MKFSPQQVEAFFTVGYVTVEGLYSAAEVAGISAALDRLQRKAEEFNEVTEWTGSQFVVEPGCIKRIVWVAGAEPFLDRMGSDPRLTGPASQLLGSPTMNQLICQAHFKMPGDGVTFPWHQDSQIRGFGTDLWRDVNGRGSYVQTLTAIDEMGLDNSPLMVMPGSSTLGHLALDHENNRERYVDHNKLVPVLMKPGSTLFFHPYLIHGSGANEAGRPRRVFINGFSYPGANFRVYPGCEAGRLVSPGAGAPRRLDRPNASQMPASAKGYS